MAIRSVSEKRSRRLNRKVDQRSAMKQMVRDMIASKEELKNIGATIASLISTTPTLFSMSQTIVQGVGDTQRIGDQINVRSIDVRMICNLNAAGSVSQTIRYVLFRDTQGNGAVPAHSDLFDNSSITAQYSPVQIRNRRFVIIEDRTFPLCLNGQSQIVSHRKHKVSFPVTFNATTNVAGANGKNALYIWGWSDQAAVTPFLTLDAMINYTDS